MTRVVYLGAVVSNGGDAAIMEAQIAAMDRTYPGHVAVLHDNAPDVARRLFPRCEVLPPTVNVVNRPAGRGKHREAVRRWQRMRVRLAARVWRVAGPGVARRLLTSAEGQQVDSIARADVVAYTGGTTLIEKYSVKGKVFEAQLAFALGRPLVMLPQSLGPFLRRENQRLVRKLVGRADLVLLRDERSLQHLHEIGADTTSVEVVPDIVFALAEQADLDRLAVSDIPRGGARIAVSVRDCRLFYGGPAEERDTGQERYERAVAGLVERLVRDRGASVTFLSTCQGVPEYWTDDSQIALSIAGRLPDDVRGAVVVDRGYRAPRDLAAAYRDFDLVVCTRLHAAILALDGGTPVLPVAYEFKTHEVMKQLGLHDLVVDIADISEQALLRSFDALVAELPSRRARLVEALAAVVGRTGLTGAQVSEAVGRRG